MKREHSKIQSYINWLKSLGCVFYAPLDSDNGLKDLISGVTGTVVTGSTVTWDANEGAYLVKKMGSGYCGIEWHGLNMSLYDNASDPIEVSYLMEHKTTKGYGNNCTQTLYPCLYNRSFAINVGGASNYRSLNVWYKRALCNMSDGNVGSIFYCDGVQDYTVARNYTRWNVYTTPNIGVEWQNMGPWTTDYNNHWAYLKNFMIFNRNLSQNEIKLIQQIP